MKTKTFKFISIALFLAFTFGSCGKKAVDVDPNFIGSWYSTSGAYTTIDIESGGLGTVMWNSGLLTKTATGRVRVKGGDKLKIGIKKYKIDQFPAETTDPMWGSIWTMRLDGQSFEKFW